MTAHPLDQEFQSLELKSGYQAIVDSQTGKRYIVKPDGKRVLLNADTSGLLVELFSMRSQDLLTTQQVADLIGFSRPTTIRLLERYDIPVQQEQGGKHRRIRRCDVDLLLERYENSWLGAMGRWHEQAVDDGTRHLSFADYADTLKEVRAELAAERRSKAESSP